MLLLHLLTMDTQTPANTYNTQRGEPDPSVLTTQQLWREVANLKEMVVKEIERMDKAIDLAHADLVRVPTDVQKAVGALKELHEAQFLAMDRTIGDRVIYVDKLLAGAASLVEEKLKSVDSRFSEKDKQVAENFHTAESAVSKQNQHFEISINKSELFTQNQFNQVNILITSMKKEYDDKFGDLKDRLSRSDGSGRGRAELWGYVLAAILLIIAAAGYVTTHVNIK